MEKLFVIKIGGNIIDDESKLITFLKEFAAIGHKKILVHGGGKIATQIAEKLNIPQQMADGRRITDAETLKVVTMVYAGFINKNIVAKLQALQCNAAGLSGADGNLIPAKKREDKVLDYGFAGDVDSSQLPVNSWKVLLENGFVPVLCPITHDGRGGLLNTNADTIAQSIAKALAAAYEITLIYLFEKNGVLFDINNDQSVIPTINRKYYGELKTGNKIFAGMLPKLDTAFEALQHGIKKVVIGSAQSLKQLMAGTSGTTIVNE